MWPSWFQKQTSHGDRPFGTAARRLGEQNVQSILEAFRALILLKQYYKRIYSITERMSDYFLAFFAVI